jgi:FKBP-type peptidyl-prolyl cis-trans isomerase FkpA
MILLPALALAQTPPATTPAAGTTPATAPVPAKKAPAAATPAKKAPAAATSPDNAAVPKPATTGTAGAGRGTAGRGAAGRGAVTAPKPVALAPLTTDDQKTVYALGLMMGQSLAMFNLSPAEMELVKRALTDSANGKPALELSEWGPKIQPLATTRAAAVAVKEKASSAAYLAKAAAEPGAFKAESGMIYRELKPGTGESPKATDTVKVHYRGTLVNGTEFDSSYKRNEPAQFPLNGVIKCWTEGVQRMKVGGKSVLVCPSDLAYGDQGRPSIPGGATLIFEIELLEIAGAK